MNSYRSARRSAINLLRRALYNRNERLEWILDRVLLVRNYTQIHGSPPNLKTPATFNEKVLYRMLYDRRPLLTTLVDKVAVRDVVAARIGSRYLARVYAIVDDVSELDPSSLPESFILKTNHGSGMNMVVPNKSEWQVDEASRIFRKWLNTNYYVTTREWAYRDVPPKLLVEELLVEGPAGSHPLEWKFYVFDGKCPFFKVNWDREMSPDGVLLHLTCNIYDRQLRRVPLRVEHDNNPSDPPFPHNMDEMFSVVETLGQGFDFVRVDLYNIRGRIVFGELTIYPAAAGDRFDPPEYEYVFGRHWRLPL
jgi:hypothetical protein